MHYLSLAVVRDLLLRGSSAAGSSLFSGSVLKVLVIFPPEMGSESIVAFGSVSGSSIILAQYCLVTLCQFRSWYVARFRLSTVGVARKLEIRVSQIRIRI